MRGTFGPPASADDHDIYDGANNDDVNYRADDNDIVIDPVGQFIAGR